jgi:hypothetical protein
VRDAVLVVELPAEGDEARVHELVHEGRCAGQSVCFSVASDESCPGPERVTTALSMAIVRPPRGRA